MREIPLATKGTFSLRVKPEHLANRFKDPMLPQVLATPAMILFMENAALAAIRPYLDEGESAVGTAIDVRHLAATPIGHEVRAEAEVVRVEGRQIEFKVSASDGTEVIGRGTHARRAAPARLLVARCRGSALAVHAHRSAWAERLPRCVVHRSFFAHL